MFFRSLASEYRLDIRPIGPAWSGRCFVTAEITGSNPVWVACQYGIVNAEGRIIANRRDSQVREMLKYGLENRKQI